MAALHRWPAAPRCVAILFFISIATAVLGTDSDPVHVNLCTEVHGFVEESNNQLTIPVSKPPSEGDAIILTVGDFGITYGQRLRSRLHFSVNYTLAGGTTFTRTSDVNSILALSNVQKDSDLQVKVVGLRAPLPVPFRFYSFYATSSTCRIDVSPSRSFSALVPATLSSLEKPVSIFFTASLPQGTSAAVIYATSTNSQPALSFDVTHSSGVVETYQSGGLVPVTAEGKVFFSVTPAKSGMEDQVPFIIISVDGGESQDEDQPSNSAPPETKKEKTKGTSTFRKLLWIAVFIFFLWQIVGSAYNYHVLGQRDFMDIVPCAGFVVVAVQAAYLAAQRCVGGVQHHSGGYDSLHAQDDPYT